jgi:hypothetical protein
MNPHTQNPSDRHREHAFYAVPANQTPQGPARRRARPTEVVEVNLSPALLEEMHRRAGEDDPSLSHPIRPAVEHELERHTSASAVPDEGLM